MTLDDLRTEIIGAWHGPNKREDIARPLGVSSRYVGKIWQEAKKSGLLPADRARPSFKTAAGESDDAPIAIGDDLLLQRLRNVHGHDARRAFDTLAVHPYTDRVIRPAAGARLAS